MEIIQDKKNSLLKRREVKLVMEAGKNPSFEDAKKNISEQFKSDDKTIVISEVKGKFGRNTFLISAKIYDSVEDKKKIEPKKGQEEEKPATEQVSETSAESKAE